MFRHCKYIIDREVADFARRLNRDWPERPFLSQRRPLQLGNGNCSLRVLTSKF